MFTSKLVPRLSLLRRASCAVQAHGEILNRSVQPVYVSKLTQRTYSTSADNTPPPRWVQLEPDLDEALVPRKLSVSPLESWLSLRYSLPPQIESAHPHEDIGLLEERVLPPISIPVFEDGEGSPTPLNCKNDMEIRRRKMNRHKYKKLVKRTKFLRRRVRDGRRRKKQARFEEDLRKIWSRAGLKSPDKLTLPKVYVRHGNKRN